jgi:hypothetical protein
MDVPKTKLPQPTDHPVSGELFGRRAGDARPDGIGQGVQIVGEL